MKRDTEVDAGGISPRRPAAALRTCLGPIARNQRKSNSASETRGKAALPRRLNPIVAEMAPPPSCRCAGRNEDGWVGVRGIRRYALAPSSGEPPQMRAPAPPTVLSAPRRMSRVSGSGPLRRRSSALER
jgi:hypothetical protein